MKKMQRVFIFILMFSLLPLVPVSAQTTFKFGGYVKLDMMQSKFHNGSVPIGNAIRDFHFPAAIPVGGTSDVFSTIDYHAKESRFNLGTQTKIGDKDLKSFVEMDFLLAGQGDERVSNSFNPRLRHFYFSYDQWLFGQTWTTFQILDIPDDLDFAGAADGIIFNRQPLIRYTRGGWQFAIENAETTLDPYGGGGRITSGSAFFPDLVARYNFSGDWGNLSVAGLFRQLNYEYEDSLMVTKKESAVGYGITFGGKIKVGKKDDLRFQVSGGSGMGRYAALNFANSAVIKQDNTLKPTPSYLGFVGYRHFWNDRLRTNVNFSGISVDNDPMLAGNSVNKMAWSLSANLLYSPAPVLTFGFELMRGVRELESGVDGKFDRLQFSAKYAFGFASTVK
ncbi:MAG: TonB-dependent receptor [bacterium]|nr:MAG: TonB-dependent receptor [bacterium]